MKRIGFAFGTAFGFFIGAARMSDPAVIHQALLLRNAYMFLLMGSAVAVAMPLLWLLQRRGLTTRFGGTLELTSARIERKHVYGGLVFGAGWAIACTCPAPTLVMVGTGSLLGLCTAAGMFCGLALRDEVVKRAESGSAIPTGAVAPVDL